MDKQLTLDRWITGVITTTEAEKLTWVVPLQENTAQKQEIIFFIIGVVEFVKKKLKTILSKHADIQTAMALAENEEVRFLEQITTQKTEATADWLEKAGATPNDLPGSIMLGMLFAQRYYAQQLLEHIQRLNKDARYAEALQELFPISEIMKTIKEGTQSLGAATPDRGGGLPT